MNPSRIVRNTALAGLIAVYTAVRLWKLTEGCLWFDEIFSVHAAETPWASILWFVSLDLIHPPLFYVLLKLWISIGNEGLFWLRLLPVLLSVIAVFPFIGLCRELKLRFSTQIFALFLLTTNGTLIKYSQEVRMYSLLMCLSLFSVWLFARYFVKGKSFVPLVIVNALMVYSHYFGWFVIMSEVALILWFQRIKWRRIAVMFGIVLVSFAPWVVAIWRASRTGSGLGQNIGWMSRPGPIEVATFVFNVIEPFYHQKSSAEPITDLIVSIPLLLITIAAAGIYAAKLPVLEADDRRNAWLLLGLVKLPVLFVFAASWVLTYSIWGSRHLVIVIAPFCVLLAVIITYGKRKWISVATAACFVIFSSYAFMLQTIKPLPQYSWCSWGPLTAEAAADPTDGIETVPVYALEDLIAYQIWFSERNALNSKFRLVKLTEVDGVNEDKAYFLPRGFDKVGAADFAGISDKKLWLAYRSRNTSDSEPPLRNFIVRGYRITARKVKAADGETATMVLLEK